MKIDKERIKLLLYEIKENAIDLEKMLAEHTDAEISSDTALIKAIKYTLIEVAEAISLVLQHILAKEFGQPVKGYVETILRASELKIISENLSNRLKPFFDFRNSLIHRYWTVKDETLIKNCREGYRDFSVFIEDIENFLKNQ